MTPDRDPSGGISPFQGREDVNLPKRPELKRTQQKRWKDYHDKIPTVECAACASETPRSAADQFAIGEFSIVGSVLGSPPAIRCQASNVRTARWLCPSCATQPFVKTRMHAGSAPERLDRWVWAAFVVVFAAGLFVGVGL